MSYTSERAFNEVREGRLRDVPTFILEHILYNGAGEEVEEMVTIYFERLETED